MKPSGLPKYVTWVHVNGKRYARARKHGKGHYFKSLPGTEEFASEYQRWLAGHDTQRDRLHRVQYLDRRQECVRGRVLGRGYPDAARAED